MGGRSKQRNRVIAEVFSQMGLIEGWGTGLQNIRQAAAEYHLPEPEFIELGETFRVNLYRKMTAGRLESIGDASVMPKQSIGDASVMPKQNGDTASAIQEYIVNDGQKMRSEGLDDERTGYRPICIKAEERKIMGKGIFSKDAVLVLAACFCFMSCHTMVIPVLAGFTGSLGGSGLLMGTVVGMTNLVSIGFRMMSGGLVDRVAKGRLSLWGAALMLAGCAGCALAQGTGVLLAARVAHGVGFACAHLFNYVLQISLLNLFIWLGVGEELAPVPVYCIAIPTNFVLVRFVFVKMG